MNKKEALKIQTDLYNLYGVTSDLLILFSPTTCDCVKKRLIESLQSRIRKTMGEILPLLQTRVKVK